MSTTHTLAASPPVRAPLCRSAQISVTVADGLVTVGVTGALDIHTAARLRHVLLDACDLCAGLVQLNLSRYTSGGIDVTAIVHEALSRARARRIRLQVIATSAEIHDVLSQQGVVKNPHLAAQLQAALVDVASKPPSAEARVAGTGVKIVAASRYTRRVL